eukprot:CAMPEP_0204635424 /NCGR_PEP_ID=MMETSP0717-20131115/31478_1 /ASSEMBLY_ACC=CAM_ASM_000666 /TAXON_ID=230516 /ORGANISM="Chaetoceros curvisetus" /LENGTH=138 /DNA_ID=CAMNT_0051654165 /DNA_START=64 /DNA_END=480 /DNA_ORIENTATION=+
MFKIFLMLACLTVSYAFSPTNIPLNTSCRRREIVTVNAEGNNGQKEGPLAGVFDFFSNLDAVADDFFYKRMGKGEIFYGKRKYKPSGDVDGDYNGFGLSDKQKIDMTREYKEQWLEEKKMRDEIRMLKEEREKRNSTY